MSDKKSLILKADQASCPFPRRLMIMLYDALILLALLILASALALPFGPAEKVAFVHPGFTLWLFFVCFIYLANCWRRGVTVGMRAWKTRLVSAGMNPLSWPRCALRFAVGIISITAFGLGILWALWDKNNRTWHDLAAGTVLIRESPASGNKSSRLDRSP